MTARILSVFAACTMLVAVGCSNPNPLFCDSADDCAGDLGYCDYDGVFGALARTCVSNVPQDSCNKAELCPSARVCDNNPTDTFDGTCVECLKDPDCGTDRPVCDVAERTCVTPTCMPGTAGDMDCASRTPNSPYCGSNERCVECLEISHCSTEARPACDIPTGNCRKCESNTECSTGVCDIEGEGVCLDEAKIIYISATGSDGAECGWQATPCAKFGGSGGGLSKITQDRNTVVVQTGSLNEQVVITGQKLTIIGQEEAWLAPTLGADDKALTLSAASEVLIHNLVITSSSVGTDSIAVECDDSTLTFEDTTIRNIEFGINADNCELQLLRSQVEQCAQVGVATKDGVLGLFQSIIRENASGGLHINGGDFEIVNCLIADNGTNGDSGSPWGGIKLEGILGDQRFDFNTVASNRIHPQLNLGSAIHCTDSNLEGENNIVTHGYATPSVSLVGPSCSFKDSLIEGGSEDNGNINATATFVSSSDYHLVPESRGVDEASGGDLKIDIDGDARPQGSDHDMGMDEVLVQ